MGFVLETRSLLQRARAGDREARGGLYEQLAPEVQRFLVGFRVPRDQVHDGVQETFLRLFGQLERVDSERPLKPYVLGIARRVALEQQRKRPGAGGDVVEARDDDSASGKVARAEERALVGQALAALEPDVRAALVLRHVNGLTMRELAAGLGCSVPTARQRLRGAAHLLARELRRRGVVPGEVS